MPAPVSEEEPGKDQASQSDGLASAQEVPAPPGVDLRLASVALATWSAAILGLRFGSKGVSLGLLLGTALGIVLTLLISRLVYRRNSAKQRSGESRPVPQGEGAKSAFRARMRAPSGLWDRHSLSALVVAFACLCAWWNATSISSALESSNLAQARDGTFVQFEGLVSSDLRPVESHWQKGSWRTTIAVASGGNVFLTLSEEVLGANSLVRGSKVAVAGKLRKDATVSRPLLGFVQAGELTIVQPAPRWQRNVYRLKQAFTQLVNRTKTESRGLVPGMALGDDREIGEELRQAMLTTSLSHLTAVSGSHIAVTVNALTLLMPGRTRLRIVFMAAFLSLIVVVVGPEPAVLRAVGMGSLAAFGLLLGRSGQPLTLLFVVTTCTVLISPWSAVSAGFILSTLATFGILTLGRSWSRALTRYLRENHEELGGTALRIVTACWDAFSISAAAYLFTVPVLAAMNPWLPTWGLLANLVVAPAVAPLTLLGLFAAFTCLWAPGFADLAIAGALPFASFMGWTAEGMARWPWAQLPWPSGLPGVLLASTATVMLAVALSLALWPVTGKNWLLAQTSSGRTAK